MQVDVDGDEELQTDAEAVAYLKAFRDNPHFCKIQQAMRNNVTGKFEVPNEPAVPDPNDDGEGMGFDGKPPEGDDKERARTDKRDAGRVHFAPHVKEDIEQLWNKMHGDGGPSAWTKEQLFEAVTNVQNTKHRNTAEGISVKTGGC